MVAIGEYGANIARYSISSKSEQRENTPFLFKSEFSEALKHRSAKVCYGLIYIILELRRGENIYFIRIILVQLVCCKFFQLKNFVGWQ